MVQTLSADTRWDVVLVDEGCCSTEAMAEAERVFTDKGMRLPILALLASGGTVDGAAGTNSSSEAAAAAEPPAGRRACREGAFQKHLRSRRHPAAAALPLASRASAAHDGLAAAAGGPEAAPGAITIFPPDGTSAAPRVVMLSKPLVLASVQSLIDILAWAAERGVAQLLPAGAAAAGAVVDE